MSFTHSILQSVKRCLLLCLAIVAASSLRAEVSSFKELLEANRKLDFLEAEAPIPSVRFILPANGSIYAAGTIIFVQVDASDDAGTITGVDLYLNGQFVRKDETAPYQWGTNDPLLRNMSTGTYSLRAIATNNLGQTAEMTIAVTVLGAINQAPTVNITSPTNGQTLTAGTDLNVSATASDSDGNIAQVQLFLNNSLVGTDAASPYSWNSNTFNALQNLQVGTYSLRVVATDNDGATADATTIITVEQGNLPNQLPSIAFTSPANNATFNVGDNVQVNLNATDSDGSIVGVKLFLNSSLVREDLAAPYSFGQNDAALQNMQAGTYVLLAVAEDDDGATSSATITITVSNPVQNQPPTVSFIAPANNQQFNFGAPVSVSATASDSDGIVVGVRLFLDGNLLSLDPVVPYNWGNDVSALQNLSAGNHTLRLEAEDDDGATFNSTITITVLNPVQNQPPSVSFLSPNNNQQFNFDDPVSVSGTASDSDGVVVGVRLFLDGTLLSLDPVAPYSWGNDVAALQNLSAGIHTLRLEAEDDDGATSSSTINITVLNQVQNQLPVVFFTAPTDNQQFNVGDVLTAQVNASDLDGTITGVSLFLNTTLIREDAVAPYTWGANDAGLQNLQAGTYVLRAVARDNDGGTREASITITIVDNVQNSPPSVAFISPTANQTFTEGASLGVEATASDTDGTVAHVDLYFNGTFIRRDFTSPYQWGLTEAALQNLSAGNYTLRLVAQDNDGATTESTINIQVQASGGSDDPVVSFLTPMDQATFDEGATVFVDVAATSSVSTIDRVDLFINGQSVRRERQPPYEWGKPNRTNDQPLRNLTAGSYILRAVATDKAGNSGEASITIVVGNGNGGGGGNADAPTISFAQPTHQQQFNLGATLEVEVNATANNINGFISKVDLFLDGTLVSTEIAAPYIWSSAIAGDQLLDGLAVGTYTLLAVAESNDGETSQTSIQIEIVESGGDDGGNGDGGSNADDPFTLNILQPMNQEIFQVGDTLHVIVEAEDTTFALRGVELYVNDTLIGQKRKGPYEWNGANRNFPRLRNLTAGTKEIRVLASNAKKDSIERTISIIVNEAPTIALEGIADGAMLSEDTSIIVRAIASDMDGRIVEVELFLNDQSVRVDQVEPYEWGFNDTPLQNLMPGQYTLKAVATDNDGSTAEVEIAFEVLPDNFLPILTFVTPTNFESIPSGTDVEVTVDASDTDGSIVSVELYLNDNLVSTLTTAPYTWGGANQDDTALENITPGNYVLRAVATDNEGGTTTTEISIQVFLANTPPIVTVDTPFDGQIFPQGTDLYVNAGAFDTDGTIDNVTLYLNDNLVRKIETGPYEWDGAINDSELSDLQMGSYTLEVVAEDNEGGTTEAEVTISVIEANLLPEITFIGVMDQEMIPSGTDLPVEIQAVDPDGTVRGVSLYVNGELVNIDQNAPYLFGQPQQNHRELRDLQPGTYVIRAEARDDDGETARKEITITVFQANVAPTVFFDTPAAAQQFEEGINLYVNAGAVDSDGTIVRVGLYINDELVRNDTEAPYEWGRDLGEDVSLEGLIPGLYNLELEAEDNDGAIATTSRVIQVMEANDLPLLSFTQPSDGAILNGGDPLTIQASASDPDGSIQGVELFINGFLIRNDQTAPYRWRDNEDGFDNLAAGSYTLKAVATDNEGGKTEVEISVEVTTINQPPIVTFGSPNDGALLPFGTDLSVSVGAIDVDGTVNSVTLLINGEAVGTDNTAPYQWGRNSQLLRNLEAGTYTLIATATDDNGESTSETITITVDEENDAPIISFDTPFDDATFPEDTDLDVIVSAVDPDGMVAGVELFLNDMPIGTDATAPYEWGMGDALLQDLTPGIYRLKAVATDNRGLKSELTITIEIFNVNQLPSVAFVSPQDQAMLQPSSILDVQVDASDPDGTIKSVALFLNDQLVRADLAAPYRWGELDAALQNLAPGNYLLKAVATDSDDATVSDEITITIVDPNSPPVVNFTSPTNQESFIQGENLSVTIDATDANGSISSVSLFINDQLVRHDNSAPYTFGSNEPLLQNLQVGTYILRAVARDNEGASTQTTISIQVVQGNIPPLVTITQPFDQASFPSGTDLEVTATATDTDGTINAVELYLNGTLVGSDDTAPYTWGFADAALQNLQVGNYMLRAVAIDNEGGSSETTTQFSVFQGNIAPTISFINPTNQQQIEAGTDLVVEVDATDADGTIELVTLRLDDQLLSGDETAPYTFNPVALRNLQVGTYTLKAVARDDDDERSEAVVTFTVVEPNALPTVSFTSPSNLQQFEDGDNLNVSINANDTDGTISRVTLYLNDQLVGTDNTAPYEFGNTFSLLQSLQVGNYTLRAVVEDNDGGITEETISISVTIGNLAPIVNFTRPTDQEVFEPGSLIQVRVDATDQDGSVQSVGLYLDGVLVREEFGPPYQWGLNDAAIQNLPIGSYQLQAVATDNQGKTGDQTITIVIADNNNPPIVSFNQPTDQAVFTAGDNLDVIVSAVDTDGAISRVDLFMNNQLIRRDENAPYRWNAGQGDSELNNLTAGTYNLRAVAIDNDGGSTSETITITVLSNTSNSLPVVSFDTPAANAQFNTGTDLEVTASAFDSDGQITSVALFLNNTLVRTDVTAPYTWGTGDALLENLQAGSYNLRLLATDNNSGTSEATRTITVVGGSGGNDLPIVSFVTPVNQQIFNIGDDVLVLVSATDSDGSVVGVDLYLNEVLVRKESGAPYEWGKPTQNDPALKNMAAGNYTLRAVARDNDGGTSEASIDILVGGSNTAPLVTFGNLTNQQTVSAGTDLFVLVNATDANGDVLGVELFLDNQSVRVERTAPYEWGKATQNDPLLQNLSAGTYILRAEAQDDDGEVGTATIQINVVNTSNGEVGSRATNNIEGLSIYPNPARANLQIQFELTTPEQLHIDWLDQHGKVLKTWNSVETMSADQYQMDWTIEETLPSGIYFLRLRTSNSVQMERVVIKQ